MEFKAKRLRIQIPCGGSGSVIDVAEGVDVGDLPAGGCGDSPQSAFCPPPPPKPPPPPPPCGVPSHFFGGNPWEELWDPEIKQFRERFVLRPEELPSLRREMQLRLRTIELAEQAAAATREQVESNLADIEAAEQKLKEMER